VDLLGDIGGISYLFTSFLGFFFLSISEFGVFIDAFNILFKLKEGDAMLLFNHDGIDHSKERKIPPNISSPFHKQKVEKLTTINFT
jgi:hypothetical protein